MTTHTTPRRQSKRQIRRIIRAVRNPRITWAEIRAAFPVVNPQSREVRP